MSPMHFNLLEPVMKRAGYNVKILEDSPSTIETGLKYIHNDACYPAIIALGSLMDALLSGKYDLSKTAIAIQQTGGGCRSSNYIAMLRFALKEAKLEHVPVLSINLGGSAEKNPGFKATVPMLRAMAVGTIYGDLLMRCLY